MLPSLPRPTSPPGRGPHTMWGVRASERSAEGRVRGPKPMPRFHTRAAKPPPEDSSQRAKTERRGSAPAPMKPAVPDPPRSQPRHDRRVELAMERRLRRWVRWEIQPPHPRWVRWEIRPPYGFRSLWEFQPPHPRWVRWEIQPPHPRWVRWEIQPPRGRPPRVRLLSIPSNRPAQDQPERSHEWDRS